MNYVMNVWTAVVSPVVGLFANRKPVVVLLPATRVSSRKVQQSLLAAFASAGQNGLTDFDACRRAGLPKTAKRSCSYLRESGLIFPTGRFRAGRNGQKRMVCALAEFNVAARREAQSEFP
jgi:hypothetical protein